MYKCDFCNKIENRSIDDWEIECTCGRSLLEEGKYKYICAECGYRQNSNTDNIKQCSECGSINIVCCYTENRLRINEELYNDILANARSDDLFTYICTCGKKKYLYSPELSNVACTCGELMQVLPSEYMMMRLKEYRQRNKLTQKEIAKRYRISPVQYSKIEQGKNPIPFSMLKLIKNA